MINGNEAKKSIILIFVCLLFILLNPVQPCQIDESNKTIRLDQVIRDPIHINSNSDFFLSGFPGSGSKEDPYRIENYYITSLTESCGVNISSTSKHFIIQNCIIDCVDYGICISWVEHGTVKIINNTITNHNYAALRLWDASASVIKNNTFSFNENGIFLDNSDDLVVKNNNCNYNINKGISTTYSENITLENNLCSENEIGIDIMFFRNDKITKNMCAKNLFYGIKVFNIFDSNITSNIMSQNKDQGIFIAFSENVGIKSNTIENNEEGFYGKGVSNSEIFNNTVNSNRNIGMKLYLFYNNYITFNRILNNSNYGLFLNVSDENLIHHNNFINNSLDELSQAYSSQSDNNTWYDIQTLEGNYWSNWLGGGFYQIEGSFRSHDFYPLEEPVPIPRPQEFLEQNPYLILWVVIPPAFFIIVTVLFLYIFNLEDRRKIKYPFVRETLDYLEEKRKIAYSDNVGTALFRFGEKGGDLVTSDLRQLNLNLEMFIGYCYATIGLGQRYETGVFGPLPTPSLQRYNVIIFAFWGLDDEPSDPRLEGKQYYIVAVIFPESQNRNLVRVRTMNDKFRNYMKKFEYPNRMTLEELNYFREIVFV